MSIPDEALDLIKSFEGYLRPLNDGSDRVRPYLCPARVATIGYGSIYHPGGRRVRMADTPIDHATALRYLAWEIETKCEPAVDRYVRVPLHPLMRGALVSFAFNCGTGALKRSTLLKRVNAERWEDVPKEFAKWRMGGGRVLRGLVRRRKAEAAMFMAGVKAIDEPDSPIRQRETPLRQTETPSRQPKPAIRKLMWNWLKGLWGQLR